MAASSSTLFSCRAPTVSVQSMCEQEFEFGTFRPCTISPKSWEWHVHSPLLWSYQIPYTRNFTACGKLDTIPQEIPAQKLSELDQTRADPLRITAHIAWVTMTFVHWGGNQSSGRWAVCCPFNKDCWGCWYAPTCETSDSQVTLKGPPMDPISDPSIETHSETPPGNTFCCDKLLYCCVSSIESVNCS